MKLYTVREASELLCVHQLTIYRAVQDGRLRAVRLGGGHGPLRVSAAAILDYAKPARPARLSADLTEDPDS